MDKITQETVIDLFELLNRNSMVRHGPARWEEILKHVKLNDETIHGDV